ncbi:RNA polymerase sigma factor [Rossellomorea sp. YZS02]|uniref:RNA polymerase sigma factor n=1 Tax=Rossellomorea sp. YZS02 TaxID=3097358 RepID=UPI002A175F73|nr:RNA polymerase sigma factor [Rossellomorea sp. YZS02]MDX8345079.1 RNA polymerase sigma factor [Rossellomorea sp. YZS02]
MDTLASPPSLTYEGMYEQFHKLIYHIAYNITKDLHLSQDIVQETFLKAYLKIDTLLDVTKTKSWLTSIARCTAIDVIRKRSKCQEVFMEDQEELHSIQDYQSLESVIEVRFLKSCIQDHIKTLPRTQQEVMALKVTEDMSDSEIALKLNLSASTVKTRFHRGRKQLYSVIYTKVSA